MNISTIKESSDKYIGRVEFIVGKICINGFDESRIATDKEENYRGEGLRIIDDGAIGRALIRSEWSPYVGGMFVYHEDAELTAFVRKCDSEIVLELVKCVVTRDGLEVVVNRPDAM